MSKTSKHDQHVETLIEQLSPYYDAVTSHVPIVSKRNRRVAEIDILAVKNDKYDVYEVKCSFRITKAKQQLDKIRKHMKNQNKEVKNAFFFCAESGLLVEL